MAATLTEAHQFFKRLERLSSSSLCLFDGAIKYREQFGCWEYERILAAILASDWAVLRRPTGPAATSAAPPKGNLLCRSFRSALVHHDFGPRSPDLRAKTAPSIRSDAGAPIRYRHLGNGHTCRLR